MGGKGWICSSPPVIQVVTHVAFRLGRRIDKLESFIRLGPRSLCLNLCPLTCQTQEEIIVYGSIV